MEYLRETDYKILSLIYSAQAQGKGIRPQQIAETMSSSKQLTRYYLQKLERKGYIRRVSMGALIEVLLTEKGKEAVKGFFAGGETKHTKPFTQAKPTERRKPRESNLHAFEAHYYLNPTEYPKVEATLRTMAIQFKTTGNRKSPQFTFRYKNITIQIGHRQIVAWGPGKTAPLNVPEATLVGQATEENIRVVDTFLMEAGLKAIRGVTGNLFIRVRYFEIGLMDSDLAKAADNRGYVALAYDRVSGRTAIWMDDTPTQLTLEMAKVPGRSIHDKLMPWAQGIVDGEIDPYKDEMDKRRRLKELERDKEEVKPLYAKLIERLELMNQAQSQMADRLWGHTRQRRQKKEEEWLNG